MPTSIRGGGGKDWWGTWGSYEMGEERRRVEGIWGRGLHVAHTRERQESHLLLGCVGVDLNALGCFKFWQLCQLSPHTETCHRSVCDQSLLHAHNSLLSEREQIVINRRCNVLKNSFWPVFRHISFPSSTLLLWMSLTQLEVHIAFNWIQDSIEFNLRFHSIKLKIQFDSIKNSIRFNAIQINAFQFNVFSGIPRLTTRGTVWLWRNC